MKTPPAVNAKKVQELLYQALETEIGGIHVYENAIACAQNEDLRTEWTEYLEETHDHRTILLGVFSELGLDPDKRTPGREVVKHIGESLVRAMQMARANGEPGDAELVACECVVFAETKDHMNWQLLGKIAKDTAEDYSMVLLEAHQEVEPQEDHHLYHSKGWTRELWMQTLGMPAVLPPPEEVRDVQTAMGAAQAEKARTDMLGASKQPASM